MTKNAENRQALDALTSMVRCLAANYASLTREVKQVVLREVRAELGRIDGGELSLILSDRSPQGSDPMNLGDVIFSTPCSIPPMASRNCAVDTGGPLPTDASLRSLRLTPGDLAAGVGVIHDELATCDDSVGVAFLQDLAYLLELFEPRG